MSKPIIEFILYHARDGWRITVRHSNGNILFDGGEAYKRKVDAKSMIQSFVLAIDAEQFVIVEKKK